MSELKPGDRVRLTRDLLDHTTTVHPVHLFAGDVGTVVRINRVLGFQSDRWGDIVSVRRAVAGEYQPVLMFCEPVENEAAD